MSYYPPNPTTLDQKVFRHYYREINTLFDSTLLKNGFNGSILIALKGQIIYEKYQGLIDLRKINSITDQSNNLTDSTALHIASVSKTFTAIAILRLIQEKKLTLNDSIPKFFPSFPYPGITIKMLLNHRSGLPNYVYFLSKEKYEKKKYVSNQDVLDFMINKKPIVNYSPDTHFSYCNTNYILLALILEKITGKPFPDFMKENIFDPLQMKHTYVFVLKDTLTSTPSFTYKGTFWNNDMLDATYGDKNVYTTPRDLLKWDQALYSDQVIHKSLLDSAFSGYSFEVPTIHNYGLGWRLQFFPNGKKVIYHFGRWHGFNAAFTRLTDEKATIIILGNKFTRSIYTAAFCCYDIFGNYHQNQIMDEEEDSENNILVKAKFVPAKQSKKPLKSMINPKQNSKSFFLPKKLPNFKAS